MSRNERVGPHPREHGSCSFSIQAEELEEETFVIHNDGRKKARPFRQPLVTP